MRELIDILRLLIKKTKAAHYQINEIEQLNH